MRSTVLFALFATVSQIGILTFVHNRHTALLQSDGRVVVIGGGERAIEWFDPRSRSVETATDALPVPLSEHAATILDDGRVLITGGCAMVKQGPFVHLFTTDTAEIFDPATGIPSHRKHAIETLRAHLYTPAGRSRSHRGRPRV